MKRLMLLCCALSFWAVGAYSQESAVPSGIDLLESARRVALSIPSPARRIGALCEVARVYAQSGRREEADACFERAVECMGELVYTDRIWSGIITTFASAGQYDYAVRAARLLKEAQTRHEVLPSLVDRLIDGGRFEEAREVAKILLENAKEHPRPDVRFELLLTAARACGRAGDAKAAGEGLREAVKIAGTKGIIGSPEGSFIKAFRDYANSCPYEDVRNAIEEFVEPSMRSKALMTIGAALREQGNEEGADRALADAAEAARRIENLDERVHALALVAERNSALGRSAQTRQLLNEVLASINEVTDGGLQDEAWKSLARCYAALGQHEEALDAAHKIKHPYDFSEAIVDVSLEHARAGQLQEALREMREAPDEFVLQKGIARLAKVYVQAGRYEDGLALTDEIARSGIRMAARTEIARILSARGEYQKAVRTVQLLPPSTGTTDTVAQEIANKCVENATEQNLSHNLSMALESVNLISFPYRKWGPLVQVADRYEKAGKLQEALRVLEQAENTAEDIENAFQSTYARVLTLARKARLYAAMAEQDQAHKTMNRIRDIVGGLDSRGQQMALEGVMYELVERGGLFAPASELLRSVEDAVIRTMGLWYMADRYAASGNTAAARQLLHKGIELIEDVQSVETQASLLVGGALLAQKRSIPVDGPHAEILQRVAESAETYAQEEARKAAARRATVKEGKAALAFFTQPGCASCQEVYPIIEDFKKQMPGVEVREFSIYNGAHARLLDVLCDLTEMPEDKAGLVPAVFSSEKGLVGKDITVPGLKELAQSARGLPAPWDIARQEGKWVPAVGFIAVVSGGLIDGINPCAFTVLIFFLAYLTALGRNKKEIAIAGILFTLAVFATYFAIGLGLLKVLKLSNELLEGLGRILQILIAAFVLVLAALSAWDGVLCLKGKARESTLRLPEGLQSKIRRIITRKARMGLTAGATLVLGFVVALLEFPCTGQVYVPIATMLSSDAFRASGVRWLLLYNLCFIIPLIIVFVGVFFGLTSERLTSVFQKHMAKVKFGLAGVFLLMFVFMLLVTFGVIPGRF